MNKILPISIATLGVLAAAVAPASAATTSSVANGTLTVTDDAAAHTIALRLRAGDAKKLEVVAGSSVTAFDRATFTKVVVNGNGGADTLRIDTANGDPTTGTGAEAVTLNGGDDGDTLTGAGGVQALNGGSGSDTITGKGGGDTVQAGSGNDSLAWGPGDGNDTVDGNIGTDTQTITGSDAAGEEISLAAIGGRVHVTRDVGAVQMDLLDVDVVKVSTLGGDDTVTAGSGLAAITALAIDAGKGDDVLRGGDGSDLLHGGEGQDQLDGFRGSDKVFGDAGLDDMNRGFNEGNDSIDGGTGHDRLFMNGAEADDIYTVAPGPAAGSTTIEDTVDASRQIVTAVEEPILQAAGGADSVTVSGPQPLRADLGAGDDTFRGGDGADAAFGGPGEDTFTPGKGDDTMVGEGDHDTFNIMAVDGNDEISGGDAFDRVIYDATSAVDSLKLTPQGTHAILTRSDQRVDIADVRSITVNGLAGDDFITESGDLTGIAEGHLDGGAGNDRLTSGNAGSTLTGGEGNDVLSGNGGDDVVTGGAGDDQLFGGTGRDLLFGGADDDLLFGELGDDRLDGGTGTDQLEDQAGVNTCLAGESGICR